MSFKSIVYSEFDITVCDTENVENKESFSMDSLPSTNKIVFVLNQLLLLMLKDKTKEKVSTILLV